MGDFPKFGHKLEILNYSRGQLEYSTPIKSIVTSLSWYIMTANYCNTKRNEYPYCAF